MAYGIKYRIKYCDKNNVEAKVEIEVRGYAGAVQNVKGTPDVFSLRYDLGGKQNNIISSFADINLFENPITIDDLKTLNETDIRVSFFIANDLKWQGFALPDFFETDIKNNAVISISATDRLSVLKNKSIGGFEVNVTPMRLISEVLNQTGLALNINSIINFSASGVTDVMRHLTLNGQRLTDDRGRNISAYDILSSLLALFNSYIVQRNNEWYIINKWQLENGGGALYKYSASGSYQSSSTFTPTQVIFDEINAGGRRKIEAGAMEVSLFGEYGGMPVYPSNYDFRLWGLSGFDGWSAKNSFVAMMNEKEVTGYSGNNAIIGSGSVNRRLRFKHEAYVPSPYISAYLESDEWVSLLGSETEINISINATSKNKTVFGVGIIVKDASGSLWTQNASNTWKKRDSKYTGGIYMPIVFDDENAGTNDVVSISANIGASIRASDLGDDVLSLSGASAKFVIFGSPLNAVDVFVSSAKIAIKQSGDQPQGTLFKVQQQNDFSKKFDTQTIIFHDYVRSGINGHFYPYRSDDTSIIRPITKFSANGETDYLTLLSARQASRLFSSARDVLTITIDASSFDPLAVYVCGSKKYIATESVFDFFRSKLDLRLEENVVNSTEKRDFIYSYFGEGEDTIKSIGGIAGGGGGGGTGGGGGMTSEQLEMLTNLADWWKLDEENDAIYSEKSVYSLKGVSALGLGSGGGGGGGDVDMLDSWANYTTAKANYYVPASLLVPFRNDTLSRLTSLESGSATSITTTGSGNAITSLTKSGSVITANKGLSFALASHTHTIAQITGLQGALDGKQPTISTGATSQYFRGDKTWQTLNTSVVSEGTNLYFTNARVKAYGDTLYSLLGHTHTIARITGLQGALDLKATQSDIDTAIDGIEIGGRNLLIGSTDAWKTVNAYSYNTFIVVPFTETKLEADQTYVFSWETELLSGSPTATTQVTIGAGVTSYLRDILWTGRPIIGKQFRAFTPTEDNLSQGNSLMIRWYTNNEVFSFRYRNLKLEKGNKPSADWTPSLEDQVSDWSTTDITSFSYIKNKPTLLSQFTDNIGVGSHIANTSNPHAVTTAQIGAVNLTTNQTIGGNKSFTGTMLLTKSAGEIPLQTRGIEGNLDGVLDELYLNFVSSKNILMVMGGGNVGIGTTNPLYKLDVAGTGRFTGNVTAPTFIGNLTGLASLNLPLTGGALSGSLIINGGVTSLSLIRTASYNTNILFRAVGGEVYVGKGKDSDFVVGSGADLGSNSNQWMKVNSSGVTASTFIGTKVGFGNGFTIEPSGTELVFKYNGVIKQRMLSDGTILATGGITALSTE